MTPLKMMILQLGCGRNHIAGAVKIDKLSYVGADYVLKLGVHALPFEDNSVDMAVAIHVLEHIGNQGWVGEWFHFWEELYRVLKPNGVVEFESPRWDKVWAWGDPSHSRAVSNESFIFLNQEAYKIKDGNGNYNMISPFKIKCDFIHYEVYHPNPEFFAGTLIARKPLITWWDDIAPYQYDSENWRGGVKFDPAVIK